MTRYIPKILVSSLIIATSFVVGAVEVFEKKDQQGEVEFSDQPSAGAKEIEVDPNVVKVTPVEPTESTPSAAKTEKLETDADAVKTEVIHRGVADDYEDERLLHERMERERLNANDKAIRLPEHQEMREGVKHETGHHRR